MYQVELGKKCSVIKSFHLEKRIIDFEILDSLKSSLFIVIYTNCITAEVGGNNILIFNTNFNVVYKLIDTQFYYTSTFKLISFEVPDIINIAFTVKSCKYVHSMIINIQVY